MLIAFKIKLALACAAGLVGPLAFVHGATRGAGAIAVVEPALVDVASETISYREGGDFTRAGKPAEAPLLRRSFSKPLSIMRHQVSSADYQACVEDAACPALERDVVIAIDRPAVQVNWHDANAYASWLSRKTGEHYRLPTDEEWAFAAGSKFVDDGVPVDLDNPAKRWIANYERETGRMPKRRRVPLARSASTRTDFWTSRAMSGNGLRPASSVVSSTRRAAP